MATYPTALIQLKGTALIPRAGKQVRQAASGKYRVRTTFSEVREAFVIRHYLTDSELTTLKNFYTANADIEFDFVYQADDQTYTCLFASAPQAPPAGGGYYDVTIQAVVV